VKNRKYCCAGMIALLLSILTGAVADAAPIGFNGYYDYSTWTRSETYGGPVVSSIDASGQTLTLMEPDSYPTTPWASQEFRFSHTVANSGVVSFNWLFDSTVDACCSGLNFYVNSTLFNLAGGYFGNPYHWTTAVASGTFSTLVNAGDTITFGAFSADSCCGPTKNVISSFDAPINPVPTPEPGSLMLLGSGIAGLAARYRRRWRAQPSAIS
jgi:hypothetical protein